MNIYRPHNPQNPNCNLAKGGRHPLEVVLTEEELDAHMQADIEAANAKAAERVAAAKVACADKREKRERNLKNEL